MPKKLILHKRIFYQKPTAAATKAERDKQRGRIIRFRAKLLKEANEKMKKMIAKEKADMAKFMKGKKKKMPAKKAMPKATKKGKRPTAAALTNFLFGAGDLP